MTGFTNTLNNADELLQAYTALFVFLGGSVSMKPDEIELPHICDAGLLRKLPVESRNTDYLEASRLLKSPCPLKQQCHHSVEKNYAVLLSAKNTSDAYPAGSLWMNIGAAAEDHHSRLNSLYARYGYGRAEEEGLEPDHLGIQILFANLLIEKYLTEDDYEIRELIRKDLLEFIDAEMLSWLPQWAERVSGKSVTKCYTGISGLIVGGLTDVRDILSRQKFGL